MHVLETIMAEKTKEDRLRKLGDNHQQHNTRNINKLAIHGHSM